MSIFSALRVKGQIKKIHSGIWLLTKKVKMELRKYWLMEEPLIFNSQTIRWIWLISFTQVISYFFLKLFKTWTCLNEVKQKAYYVPYHIIFDIRAIGMSAFVVDELDVQFRTYYFFLNLRLFTGVETPFLHPDILSNEYYVNDLVQSFPRAFIFKLRTMIFSDNPCAVIDRPFWWKKVADKYNSRPTGLVWLEPSVMSIIFHLYRENDVTFRTLLYFSIWT